MQILCAGSLLRGGLDSVLPGTVPSSSSAYIVESSKTATTVLLQLAEAAPVPDKAANRCYSWQYNPNRQPAGDTTGVDGLGSMGPLLHFSQVC